MLCNLDGFAPLLFDTQTNIQWRERKEIISVKNWNQQIINKLACAHREKCTRRKRTRCAFFFCRVFSSSFILSFLRAKKKTNSTHTFFSIVGFVVLSLAFVFSRCLFFGFALLPRFQFYIFTYFPGSYSAVCLTFGILVSLKMVFMWQSQ